MFQETGAVTRFPSAVMPERPQPAERDERTSPAEIVAVLWRRRLWIALGTLAGLLAAIAFLVLVTPRYMAVAQLLIDPNDLRVMDNAVTPTNALNDAATAYVESQARVLTSDTVLRKVIEQQRLDKDPEFAQPPSAFRAALDGRVAEAWSCHATRPRSDRGRAAGARAEGRRAPTGTHLRGRPHGQHA